MLRKKAKPIRLFIFDIDGIMTSGKIYYTSDGGEIRGYHIQDGLGIKLLQQAGIQVAVISGKKSRSISDRLEELKITHVHLGCDDKMPAYSALKAQLHLEDHEIAYMGDDLPDLPLLLRVGLSISVPLANDCVKENVSMITRRKAGKGAVREACEFILEAQGKLDDILKSYSCVPK